MEGEARKTPINTVPAGEGSEKGIMDSISVAYVSQLEEQRYLVMRRYPAGLLNDEELEALLTNWD